MLIILLLHYNSANFVAFGFAYVKVTLPVGLLSESFYISFLIVKEISMEMVTQRNRYYHLELALIRLFSSCRCLLIYMKLNTFLSFYMPMLVTIALHNYFVSLIIKIFCKFLLSLLIVELN